MASVQRLYKIYEVLGTGAFGSVYRAELMGSAGFRKSLALKLLHPDRASSHDIVERLRDEARLLAHVAHPGVVQVSDLVRLDGRWTIILEHVPGASLRELIAQSPIPEICAVQMVERIAEALDAAHNAKDDGKPLELVHRDIKPSNVLVTPDGSVKLVDFGVALANADVREANTDELFFGAPEYMAPERWHFSDTPAADVYSLGAVLYEMLTGELLGRTSANLDQHCDLVEDAAGRLFRLESKELRQLVERMLAYVPEERPTPREVALACKQLLPGLPGPWLRDWAEREVARALDLRIPVHNDPLLGSILEESEDDELTAVLPQRPASGWQNTLRVGVLGLMALLALMAWWAVHSTTSSLEEDRLGAARPAAVATAPSPEPAMGASSIATAPAPPQAMADVQAAGDANQVFLVDEGRRLSPGKVPPGTYDIEAWFASGRVLAGQVQLAANDQVTITCDSSQTLCRID
jgi:eukaryotic-like serine/threonine-protein kinase